MRKPTAEKVARLAGVSIATVSRVSRGTPSVTPETRERVHRAAMELGIDLYRTQKTRVLGFILSNREAVHPFHSRVLLGAEAYCRSRDYTVLVHSFRYPTEVSWRELRIPSILERRDVFCGFIVAGTNSQNFLDYLNHVGVPFAVLGNNVMGSWEPDKHDTVWFDDIQGAFEATRYLQSLGHRDIWFVGNCHLPWFARRYEGYCRAMKEAGFKPQLSGVESEDLHEVGYLACKSICVRKDPASAILAGGDAAAQGVYDALRDCGAGVPDDISVVGFDDLGASSLRPPLTTVRVFTEQIGKHLADQVLGRLSRLDRPPQQATLPTQLVKRESCRAIEAALVSQEASEAISQNRGEANSADD